MLLPLLLPVPVPLPCGTLLPVGQLVVPTPALAEVEGELLVPVPVPPALADAVAQSLCGSGVVLEAPGVAVEAPGVAVLPGVVGVVLVVPVCGVVLMVPVVSGVV